MLNYFEFGNWTSGSYVVKGKDLCICQSYTCHCFLPEGERQDTHWKLDNF